MNIEIPEIRVIEVIEQREEITLGGTTAVRRTYRTLDGEILAVNDPEEMARIAEMRQDYYNAEARLREMREMRDKEKERP